MSSMGGAWPDDDMAEDDMPDDGMDSGDWSFLGSDPGSPQPFQGIIPTPQQDQGAVFMSHSAYAPAPPLRDPNEAAPPDNGTPSAAGIGKAFSYAEQAQDVASEAAKKIA